MKGKRDNMDHILKQEKPAPEVESTQACEHLLALLADYVEQGYLSQREHSIVLARLALTDGRWQTLEEVACQIGVQKERVRQLQNRAMLKLRKQPACAHLLAKYLECVPPPRARHRRPLWLTETRTLAPLRR
jgi:DNA-directed RNA polymerase sigma subunit (sigma70/sigma32)